jgi:7-keto-8-aminopelargonate synthetase-like enzyme
MIAGTREFIGALRYVCPGLIYSTALPPVCIGGVRRTLEIVRAEFDRMGAEMWSHHRQLAARLRQKGFRLSTGTAPIAAIQCGSAEATLTLARQLFQERILSTPFIPPSVPPGQGVVRLITGAKLDVAGMEALLAALDRVTVV